NNHYKFTGKERDAETNNDYFGARYYNASMGRWLSPDWSAAPAPVPYADLSDPQSLNLYGYVRNRPTFAVDGDGHSMWTKALKILIKGGQIGAALNAGKQDIKTVFDSSKTPMQRIEAFGNAGSEFLPLSVHDAEDVGNLAGKGLSM